MTADTDYLRLLGKFVLRDRMPAKAASGFGKHVLAHAEKHHQLMKSEE
jgi:hypothetical protein